MKPTDAELIRAAFKARSFAYTPYSHFKVGGIITRIIYINIFCCSSTDYKSKHHIYNKCK